MSRKIASALALVVLLSLTSGGVLAADETFTGEVIEKGCYLDRGAHGPEHAACAKRCFGRGADAGLLTADGELLVLRPGEDVSVLERLKKLAGKQVKVTGELQDEEDGFKIVVVKAAEPVTE